MKNEMTDIANMLMDQTTRLKESACAKLAPEVEADKSEHADMKLARMNKFRRTELIIVAIDPLDSGIGLAFNGSRVAQTVAQIIGATLELMQTEHEESIKGSVLS